MDMTERDYELLSAYIDNMLAESERSALETRLLEDEDLQRELDALRDTVALVNALPTLKAPRNFTLTAEMIAPAATTPADETETKRPINFPAVSLLSTAAAFVLIVLGIVLLVSTGSEGDTTETIAGIPTTQPTQQIPPMTAALEEQAAPPEPMADEVEELAEGDMDDSAEESEAPAQDFEQAEAEFAPEAQIVPQTTTQDAPAMSIIAPTPTVLPGDVGGAARDGTGAAGAPPADSAADAMMAPQPSPEQSAMRQAEATEEAAVAIVPGELPAAAEPAEQPASYDTPDQTSQIIAIGLLIGGGLLFGLALVTALRGISRGRT
jgi:hypothetical protein